MKVPAFLLRRLYVGGSLHNTENGWAFTLRNTLASGEATGLDPLTSDGTEIPAETCFFHVGDDAIPFSAVGPERRFGLESGRDISISVIGERLPPGSHTVGMAFTVSGLGRLAFDFTDVVA